MRSSFDEWAERIAGGAAPPESLAIFRLRGDRASEKDVYVAFYDPQSSQRL